MMENQLENHVGNERETEVYMGFLGVMYKTAEILWKLGFDTGNEAW